MENETHLTSDGDDSFISVVPEHHKKFMMSKLIDFLTESEDFTLHIIHKRDQFGKMVLNIGPKPERPPWPSG